MNYCIFSIIISNQLGQLPVKILKISSLFFVVMVSCFFLYCRNLHIFPSMNISSLIYSIMTFISQKPPPSNSVSGAVL